MLFFQNLKNTYFKIKDIINYQFITKVFPFSIVCYCGYFIYKYKLYSISNPAFRLSEEKSISRKIYPLLKFKYIEKTYSDSSKEHSFISKTYTQIIKDLKLNLQNEVILIQSDIPFLHILSHGTLFISDSFFYLFNDFELFSLILIHQVLHVKNRHSTNNIQKIFSKSDLIHQYYSLKENAGYIHYFLLYYLYFPYSESQEVDCLKNSFEFMIQNGYLNFGKKEDFDHLILKLKDFNQKLVLLNETPNNFVENNLNKISQDDKSKYINEIQKFFVISNPKSLVNNSKNEDYLTNKIIWGDFSEINEEVEVYLHQRTSKKIKYKKRLYSLMHPFTKIISNLEFDDFKVEASRNSFKNSREIKKLKDGFQLIHKF